jgi:hypothetical protein
MKPYMPILAALLLTLAACSGEDKKSIGDNCSNNTDCADEVCHSGICVSKNPLKNGDPCDNEGYCKSLNCSGGTCLQGTSPKGAGCLNAEECTDNACAAGLCGGGGGADASPPQPDGGGQKIPCETQGDCPAGHRCMPDGYCGQDG